MRTLHVSTVVRRRPEQVYGFARDPANLGAWAAGLASSRSAAPGDGHGDSDGGDDDTVVVDSPMGRVSVRFLPRNELGVLDHEVTLPDGSTTYNPLRVVPHPEGAEVIFTLRGNDDDEVEQDAAMVAADLDRLRAVLEGSAPAGSPQPPARAVAQPVVRLATPADAGSLGRLLYEFNTEFGAATPDAEAAARRMGRLLARDDVLAVVADPVPTGPGGSGTGPDTTTTPQHAGFALVTLRPTPYSDRSVAQLEELYVRPALRGRGIGTALLTHALEAVSAGCAECMINVDSDDLGARRFYDRHGFSDRDPDSGSVMLCYLRQL